MRESFVIHAEYIEDLPEEYKNTYLHYIYNYGIFDEEPAGLEGFEKSIWIKIKRRIDQDRIAYEERKEKNRKRQEEWRKNQGLAKNNSVNTEPVETVSSATPSQTEYSKQIFNIFREASLPCAKNNEISFLQSDFMNGLSFIHKSEELKGIHSDDVLEACRNYVTVLEDPECYLTQKLSFYSLVKSKFFYSLLPANFDKENFRNYKNKTGTSATTEKKWYEEKPCPSCNAKKVVWSNTHNNYQCECCKKIFKIGEF